MLIESASADGTPVHSMTKSAPCPPVASITPRTASGPLDKVTSAPSSLREVSLVGAARNPDHRIRSPRLGQLHVNLSRDSQAHHNDRLSGENFDEVVAMHAGGRDLDERRNVAVDRIRQGVYVAARSHEVIRESAVGIASDERAVGTEVGLAGAAIQAHAAVNGRVDDDAIAAMKRGVSSVDHLADHFMTHDQRVADGDRAFVDVEIGAADAAMGHSDEDLVMSESGPLDFRKAQIAGPSQDHSFHESCSSSIRSPCTALFPAAVPVLRPGRRGA